MEFQYLHTEDGVGDTYDANDDVLSIHILEIQMMMVQYSHTDDVDDEILDYDVTNDGSVFTH